MDGSPIEFAISTPSNPETIRGQIAHALTLGLPEADASRKQLHLIANGPSARGYDFDALAQGHHSPEVLVDTWALNGALRLFTDRSAAPTAWLACDPQALVGDFLSGALPVETTYLVASKCHPLVFDLLKDRKVQLWHVNDQPAPGKRQVPCAVSVTISALLLAQRLGYRRIDVWGWDLCFGADGAHHAATGDLGIGEQVDIDVGEGADTMRFRSHPTWACEVTDASKVLPVLKWAGVDVVIHGMSMLAAIMPEYAAESILFDKLKRAA